MLFQFVPFHLSADYYDLLELRFYSSVFFSFIFFSFGFCSAILRIEKKKPRNENHEYRFFSYDNLFIVVHTSYCSIYSPNTNVIRQKKKKKICFLSVINNNGTRAYTKKWIKGIEKSHAKCKLIPTIQIIMYFLQPSSCFFLSFLISLQGTQFILTEITNMLI